MNNTLEIRGLQKAIRNKMILKDLNCKLENGVYGLLGPNGAGKTTLMRCITGLYHYEGKMTYNGKGLFSRKLPQIGYLPQKFGLFPELTVWEMMEYMANMKKISRKEREGIIEECLQKVNLTEEKKKLVRKLSGGMMRRLGIAQTLLGNPSIILFDEPTAGLDPEERMRFKEIIANLEKEKIVIVSTHIVEDVEACCDSIIVLDQGRILKVGSIDEIQNYAVGRVKEVDEVGLQNDNIIFIEKSYTRNGEKRYRVLLQEIEEDTEESTVEDGYLCLLKTN